MKKEIIVFTYGDANSTKTWSNVPYFFSNTLEEKGYIVHRVNVKKYNLLQRLFNKLTRIIFKNTAIEFSFTSLNAKIVNRVMKKAVKKYFNAEILIATNFSYSPASVSDKISVIFSDWTFEYLIRHFKKRTPSRWEKKEIIRQDKEIEKSDYVISLFPEIAEDMKKYYKNPNIYYLGNVINSDLYRIEDVDIRKKYNCNKILFIGQKKYINSAKEIIKALEIINSKEIRIELNIIGMNSEDFKKLPNYVHCYGYLDKTNIDEKNKYYKIIMESKCSINTSEQWAGFSSMIENMYYYLPVITSPYSEFIKTFGDKIEFGLYCNNNVNEIVECLEKIFDLSEKEYMILSKNAHAAVENFTWSNYMEKLLRLILNKK